MDIQPIGKIEITNGRYYIVIDRQFSDGLLGIEGYSHIVVLYWLDKNDTPEKRKTLRVHPRGDHSNPLTGVFATRSPARPNPIALFTCELLAVEGERLEIGRIDAFDGSPVIDIKGYTGQDKAKSKTRFPAWL